MTDLTFYLDYGNGFTQVDPPRNWKAFVITALWTDGYPSASIQSNDFEWTGVNATRIWAYREQGMMGQGPGIFEGLPMQIKACLNNSIIVFNGMLDLCNDKTRWECDKVVAPFLESGKIDWVNVRARGFDFAYLASLPPNMPGRIVPATDYKKTPYAITEIPDYTQAMLLSVSTFVLIKELVETTTKVSQLIAQLSGDAATAVATFGAAAGTLVARIAMIALYVTYLFLIVTALVNLVKDLIANIVQLKKYKLCMREETIWQRGCQFLGLQFVSTIHTNATGFKNATYMPPKNIIPNPGNPLNIFDRPADEGQGFPNNSNVGGFPKMRFDQWIVEQCIKYNAEIKVFNNILYFQPKRTFNNVNPWQIPSTSKPGYTYNFPDPHRTNAHELPSSYFLHFDIDQSELNTLHRYRGTNVSVTMVPTIVRNGKNVQLGNGVDVLIPQCQGRRKDYLSRIETLLNSVINGLFGFVNAVINGANFLIGAVNTVLSLFGGNAPQIQAIPTLPTNILNDRMDWLVLSNDSFAVAKGFIGMQNGADWVLHPQTETIHSAYNLLQQFHGRELATRGAQALIYENREFKFCCDDWNQVYFSNKVKDPTGLYQAELEQLPWNLWKDHVIGCNYRVYRNFTNNLTEKIIIDGQ